MKTTYCNLLVAMSGTHHCEHLNKRTLNSESVLIRESQARSGSKKEEEDGAGKNICTTPTPTVLLLLLLLLPSSSQTQGKCEK